MIRTNTQRNERGSVVLVALCFVTVLGIALASYLAVSNQAMKLSNRAQQRSVSRQLAEMGLEQTLLSFNRNNWDPTVWTIDAANHRASRTVTFPNTKYGNGVTGSINIRVDNFDAYNLSSIWTSSPATKYQIGDLVGYTDGMWYRCVQSHTSSAIVTPSNLAYWVPAPIPWAWSSDISYKKFTATTNGGIVFYNSTWYLCINDTSGTPSPATSPNWKSLSWNSTNSYSANDFAFSNGAWYLCNSSQSGQPLTNTGVWTPVSAYYPWAYRNAVIYNFNDVVFDSGSGNWYRCIIPTSSNDPSSGSSPDWEKAMSESWKWSSTVSYNLNDIVYVGGSFYRCCLANSNQTPPNLTYWSPDPLLSPSWDAGRYYSANDFALCNGTWYLCLSSYNGKYPVTNSDSSSGFWAPAPQSLPAWNSTKNYGINDMISDSGSWYRCIAPNLNQPTSNASYWSPNIGASYQWNSATAYTTSSYVSYDGVWYHCIVGNTNQTPNNSMYWAALGAPVIYTEGITTLPDNTAQIKTQLRANIAKAPLFANAAATTSTLKINGAGIVDSYDGSVYSKSLQGMDSSYQYNTTNPVNPFLSYPNVSYSAVLSSTGTVTPSLTISNAKVNGFVAAFSSSVSPFAPLWSYGGSAVVAETASGTGINLSRVNRSPYVPQFDTLPEPSVASAFALGNLAKGTVIPDPTSSDVTLNLGTPGGITPSRYYYDSSFSGLRLQQSSTSHYKTININGPVILYINGPLRVQSGGLIEIKSTGSAEIHCNYLRCYGATPAPSSDGILNGTHDPKKLIVIADGSSFSTTYLDNGGSAINKDFCGVIYAPNTTATLGLDIRNGVTVYGALLAKKITFSSDAALHYDTSLRYATFGGVDSPFTITEWRELTDPTEKIVLP